MGKKKQDRKKDARTETGIKKTVHKFHKLAKHFDKLASRSKKSEKAQKRLEHDTASLRKGQDNLETSVAKLCRKTARLKQQARQIHLENGRIVEQLTTEIDETYISRGRLNKCENELHDHREKLKRLSERLETVAGLRSEFEALDARLNQRIASIEAAMEPKAAEETSAPPAAPEPPPVAAAAAGTIERIMGSPRESHPQEPPTPPPVFQEPPSDTEQDDSEDLAQAIAQLLEEQTRGEQRVDHLDRLLDELRNESGSLGSVIDSLDVRLEDTAAQTESLIPQISDLAADLRGLAESTERQLLDRATELQAAIDRLDAQLAVQKGEFAEGLAGVQRDLDEQQSGLSSVRKELRGSQARMTEVETRVDEGLSAHAGALKGLDERTAGQQSRHNRLAGAFWALTLAVLILGGAFYWQTRSALNALPRPDASGWQAAVDAQSARLDEHQGLIADLKAVIAEQGAVITRQSERLDTQADVIQEQASQLSAQETRFSAQTDEVSAQSLRIGRIERKSEEQDARVSRLAEQQSRVEEVVADSGARVSEFAERQSQLEETIEKLRQRLESAPRAETGASGEAAGPRVGLKGPEWLDSLPSGHYTIQLLGVFQPRYLQEVANASGLELPMAHYQKTHDGRPWHVLLYGDFGTAESARVALEALPAPLREAGPWIRQLSAIQMDLERAR